MSPWGSVRAGAEQALSTTQPCSDGGGRSPRQGPWGTSRRMCCAPATSQGTVSPQVSGGLLLGDPGSQGLTQGT